MNKTVSVFVLAFVLFGTTSLTLASEKEPTDQKQATTEYQEGQIIAYFDEAFELVKPEQARYYRQYQGKTAQGWPIIQDFYQGSNKKNCSPYAVKPEQDLQSKDTPPWEGKVNCWFENGQQGEWFFKNGAANGTFNLWYENGQKSIQGKLKDNEFNGPLIMWNEEGQKTGEFSYKNGQFHGKQIAFSQSHTNKIYFKINEIYYINGEENGKQTYWYENGQKQSVGYMKNGKYEGLKRKWYEDGQKRSEHYYKNGNLNGLSKFWDKSGKLEKEILWQNGKIISKTFYQPDGSVKNIECNAKNCEQE